MKLILIAGLVIGLRALAVVLSFVGRAVMIPAVAMRGRRNSRPRWRR